MWRLNKVCHKSSSRDSPEQLRLKRRQHERELRQARRDRQLFSKRLLSCEDGEQQVTEQQDVVALFHKLQKSGAEREETLKCLSRALRQPSAQTTFIKLENSVQLLVGFLSGFSSERRLLAAQCLHRLSQCPQAAVSQACLPASPYLLTYLCGTSSRLTELCLYTLGNLCPENEEVKTKLLLQGLVPALDKCLQRQMQDQAVVEAVCFTLSQLLHGSSSTDNITLAVMSSSLPLLLIQVLDPHPDFGLGPAIESCWCLHALVSSGADCSRVLASHGALSRCTSLLVSLGAAVAEGKKEEGLELLVWPLLRCVGNLLSSSSETLSTREVDDRLVAALCALLHVYLKTHPALAREAAWVLNNLTAHSLDFCSALLQQNLVPALVQVLPFSQGLNTMIVRVFANVAHRSQELGARLVQLGLLPALASTLKMADTEMVLLSLELLHLLTDTHPHAAQEFVNQGGLSVIESLQFHEERELRRRAVHLLEHTLLPCSH